MKKTIQDTRSAARQQGFTIVEVAVIILVIGILAAVGIFAIGGWRDRVARDVLLSDLTNAATQLKSERQWGEAFPVSVSAANGGKGLPKSDGTSYQYTRTVSPADPKKDSYCLTGKSSRSGVPTYIVSSDNPTPREGVCPGHSGATPGGSTEIVDGSPIQEVTGAQCAALPTFTGANNEAIRTVSDSRGGTARSYRIAKLADNKCWMLDNLKLGSASSGIVLTPSDSNVVANSTLPQLTTAGSGDADTPRVYGPVSGDTGSGATNYGYLYNWSAATAGATRTSHPSTGGNAPSSVCAKGWKLPSGGVAADSGDYNVLDRAFGGTGRMGQDGDWQPAFVNWKPGGPFGTIFAGLHNGSTFSAQGVQAYFWSSTPYPSGSDQVYQEYISGNEKSAPLAYPRSYGFAIRCVLQ